MEQKVYEINSSLKALLEQEKNINKLINESSEINKNTPANLAKIKSRSEQLNEEIETLKNQRC